MLEVVVELLGILVSPYKTRCFGGLRAVQREFVWGVVMRVWRPIATWRIVTCTCILANCYSENMNIEN